MTPAASAFLLSDIRAPFDAPEAEVLQIAKQKMKRVCSFAAELHFQIYKKSFDARRRPRIEQVCTVLAAGQGNYSFSLEHFARAGVRPWREETPQITHGTERAARPLVVGMGPAGLFCALLLAEEGYRPILIDRGDGVAERTERAARFRNEGVLDPESNVQFGAGGAGTFSDGKLLTRVHDPLCHYVLRRLVEFGAPQEILRQAKPHVGTDVLRGVVDRMLAYISLRGGEVHYRTKLESFCERTDGVRALTTAGAFEAGALVLALGHSAHDTFGALAAQGMLLVPKPFSVGVRIEHLRSDIDRALYGDAAGDVRLGPAEYALSDTTLPRGVYTFCMCPGGEVVAAASEAGGVVVNGMSYHARDGRNSNAAVAVSVTPADVGGTVEGAIAFRRSLEVAAYRAGGGDYRAPVQTVGDFLAGRRGTAPSRVIPTYGGGRVTLADLHEVLPPFLTAPLAAGLRSFGRKLPGFDAPDAVLTGVETRTSSPLRMPRGETRVAQGFARVYPAGEGAGYAGGITSAALDGIHTALAIMARFAAG